MKTEQEIEKRVEQIEKTLIELYPKDHFMRLSPYNTGYMAALKWVLELGRDEQND